MNKRMKRSLILSAAFLLYTIVIKTADVRAIGPEGSSVGFGLLNGAIAKALGYHQLWYRISEGCSTFICRSTTTASEKIRSGVCPPYCFSNSR